MIIFKFRDLSSIYFNSCINFIMLFMNSWMFCLYFDFILLCMCVHVSVHVHIYVCKVSERVWVWYLCIFPCMCMWWRTNIDISVCCITFHHMFVSQTFHWIWSLTFEIHQLAGFAWLPILFPVWDSRQTAFTQVVKLPQQWFYYPSP